MANIVRIPRFYYYSYALGVAVKRLLGLSCKKHRTFFLMRVMRAFEQGRITGRLEITTAVKRDGAGAQGLARFSARCFARAYGLTYRHTAFQTMAHAELPMEEWVAAWEQLLELGAEAPLASDSNLPMVDLETYAMTPSLWREDRLLETRHFHAFLELAPTSGQQVARELRSRFIMRHGESIRKTSAPLAVRVHVRRGDVSSDDAQTKHRFVANQQITPIIKAIIRVIQRLGLACEVSLYSLGDELDFKEFKEIPGLKLMLGLSALDTFKELTDSDVLLMAQSDFSHLAALYARGVVICDPRHRAGLPTWLGFEPATGQIDEQLLSSRLRASCGG